MNLSDIKKPASMAGCTLCLTALLLLFGHPLTPYVSRPIELGLIMTCIFGMGWFDKKKTARRFDLFFMVLISLVVFTLPYSIHQIVINVQSHGTFSVFNLVILLVASIAVPMHLGMYSRKLFQLLSREED